MLTSLSLRKVPLGLMLQRLHLLTVSSGVTTIHISQINKGNEVSIDYGPVTISGDVRTSATGDIPDRSAFTVFLSTGYLFAADDITGGRTQALDGSGTMKFTTPSQRSGGSGRRRQ